MTETVSYIRNSLKELYPPGEIAGFIRLIMEHVCGLQSHHLLMGKGKELSETEKERIEQIVERLKQSEPIQYIIGTTPFCGLLFEVNPSVLIPRPETEELVDLIINKQGTVKSTILDIGTGSGCIAVTLAHHLPGSEVVAVDISDKAIATAFSNAERNNVSVSFVRTDILDIPTSMRAIPGTFDLIVSNPPYVMESEKAFMQKNVLLYEPDTALYVPDKDPLLFYKAIASFGREKLNTGGCLYLEINTQYGNEMIELLESYKYKNIKCTKDLSGKDRIISAER